MRTRAFAGAFILFGNEVLLLRRSMRKRIAPGLWAGVGGHIEPGEYGDPLRACQRELFEETGIRPDRIQNLTLRYHALCRTAGTLDTLYYFVGKVAEKYTPARTDEGELFWIPLEQGLALPMAGHVKAIYTHLVRKTEGEGLFCVLSGDNGEVITTMMP